MYPGVNLKIGDETFIVPAISLGQLRNGMLQLFKEHDEKLTSGDTWECMLIKGQAILQALRRNYPDFPEDKLFDHLDARNTTILWLAILGVSGLSPGEDEAEMPNQSGISAQSIEALPQPTAGLTEK